MIQKLPLYIFCICYISIGVNAQEKLNRTSIIDKTELKLGYGGNILWKNGIDIGAEYLWKEKILLKDRKRGQKKITHQLLFNGEVRFRTNFSTQTDTGLSTHLGMIWRRTNTKGRQFSIAVNPFGVYRSYLPDTYEVKNNEVDKVFLAGRSYYAPSFSIGIGKFRKDKKLTGRYVNLNVMFRTPYNAGILPSFSFAYGYRFKL